MPIYMVKCSSAILNAKAPSSTFKIPGKSCQKQQGNFRTTIERVISSEIIKTCTEFVNGGDPLIRKSQLVKVIERTLHKTGADKAVEDESNIQKDEATLEAERQESRRNLIHFTQSLQLRICGLESRLSDAMERMTKVHSEIARITDPRSAQAALHYCRKLRHEIKKLRRVRRHFFHYIRRHEAYTLLDEEMRKHIKENSRRDPKSLQERYRRKLMKFLSEHEKEFQEEAEVCERAQKAKVGQPRETQSQPLPRRKSLYDELTERPQKSKPTATIVKSRKPTTAETIARTSKQKMAADAEEAPHSSNRPQIYISPIPSKSQRIRPHKELRAHEKHMFPRAYFEEMHNNYRRRDDSENNWYVRAPDVVPEVVKKPERKEKPTIYGSPMMRYVEAAPPGEPRLLGSSYYSITDAIRAAIKARRNAKGEPEYATASQIRDILRPGLGKRTNSPAYSGFKETPQPQPQPPKKRLRRPYIQPLDMNKLHEMAKHPRSVDLSRLSKNCVPAKPKYHRRPRFMTELSYLSGESCLFRMKYFNRMCYKRSETSAALNTRDGYCVFPDMAQNRSFSLMPMVRRKAIAKFLLLTPDRKVTDN